MIRESKKIGKIDYKVQIAKNKTKSFILILAIILVITLLGYVIGNIYRDPFTFLSMALIISLIYVTIGYYASARIALYSSNAKPADKRIYPQYYSAVEDILKNSDLPMPKLYIMEDKQINAFASGRDPENAVICVTTGALEKLSMEELKGVLAHEMSHISNYDIRFMTLTAILVGMIGIISQMFLRNMYYNDNENRNGLWIAIGIVLAILAPIFVQLVQLAISRKREYSADASSINYTKSPKGLINALKKIKSQEMTTKSSKKISAAIAPLFISNPFSNSDLISTHPSLTKRIEILERMS
jgi:heat shock protein HtpX